VIADFLQKKIVNCHSCKTNDEISSIITFRKPLIYCESNRPDIMLVGHSPSVRPSEEAEYVLKLNLKHRPLYRYIVGEILNPLGINISRIYATNILKCKTTKLPEDVKDKSFIPFVFNYCVSLFEEEVCMIKPKLIISLSETVLKLISKKYLSKVCKMKTEFGRLHPLNICNVNTSYLPLVHIPKGNNTSEKEYYFPEQKNRLIRLRETIEIL